MSIPNWLFLTSSIEEEDLVTPTQAPTPTRTEDEIDGGDAAAVLNDGDDSAAFLVSSESFALRLLFVMAFSFLFLAW